MIKLLTEGILKKVPQERLGLQEIRNSDWLRGVAFPVTPAASESYTLTPTLQTPVHMTAERHSENVPQNTDNPEIFSLSDRNKEDLQSGSGNDKMVEGSSVDNDGSVDGFLTVQRDSVSRQQSFSGSERKENEILGIEILARKKLLRLGITSAMLEEHSSRGSRSAVIGTYRIVVHRIQRQGHLDVDATSVDDGDGLASAVTSRSPSTNHSFLPSFGRRSKSAAVKSKGRKTDKCNRSRTCILL